MLHQTYTTPFLPRSKEFQMPHLPQPLPYRYRIDPIAFIAALILAPVIPALVLSPLLLGSGGWMILPVIPLMAIYLGGIPYLVFGVPALLYLMPRHGPNMEKITGAAIAVALGMTVVWAAILIVTSGPEALSGLILGVFAVAFAALWSALFVTLFRKLERSAYRARNGH